MILNAKCITFLNPLQHNQGERDLRSYKMLEYKICQYGIYKN